MCEVLGRLGRVITQEIHGLAHLGDRIRERLAGFTHQQTQQGRQASFHQIGCSAQASRACLGRGRLPDRPSRQGLGKGMIHGGRIGIRDMPDNVAMIRGIVHGPHHRFGCAVRHVSGSRTPIRRRPGQQGSGQRRKALLIRQIKTGRIDALRAEEIPWQGDLGMWRPDRLHALGLCDRIGDQIVDRDARVRDPVHEGCVGTIFEKTAHQIGEEGLMRPHGRVDAAWPVELVASDHLVIQRLTHAMKALELILAEVEVLARHGVDRRQRLGIMRRELRKHRVGHPQQLAGAGEIGQVGVKLAREDREAFEPIHLGTLDLAVPVGPLDQTDHQPVVRPPRKIDEEIEDVGRTLLIGLHDEANAVPASKLGCEAKRFEEVQRKLKAIRLLGVDIEADIVVAR